MKRRWWTSVLFRSSIAAAVCLPLGALGSKFGLWNFSAGLLIVMIGTVLAAVIFVGSLTGLTIAYRRKLLQDKTALWLALVISMLILVQMSIPLYRGGGAPPIHNISTDMERPPAFVALAELRGVQANPLAYDSTLLGPLQRQAYPDIQTLISPEPPREVFQQSLAQLQRMGLELVASDAATGRIEATATTFWFGFKDDLVVRIEPAQGGSRVDVRSISRVGQGDLGANARRIRQFLQGLADN